MVWDGVQLDEVDHNKDSEVCLLASHLKSSMHCCKAAASISAVRVLSMIRSFVNISKLFQLYFCIQHT